jgi:hypothetical protein
MKYPQEKLKCTTNHYTLLIHMGVSKKIMLKHGWGTLLEHQGHIHKTFKFMIFFTFPMTCFKFPFFFHVK